MFWGWIRTAALRQLAMAVVTSFELCFRHSSTHWNSYEAYFHMDLDSYPYLSREGCNDQITSKRFFSQRCCVTLFFCPIGLVSSRVQ
uniref:Secreted protein n=1 Tax=Setaria viridis TaxID=4556 RepID=A0A4U6TH08_SETVI|nr:hypothetical protein SEVIR_8G085766v2 [Setaria viridis]